MTHLVTYDDLYAVFTGLRDTTCKPYSIRRVLHIPRRVKLCDIGLQIKTVHRFGTRELKGYPLDLVRIKSPLVFLNWYRRHAAQHFPAFVQFPEAFETDFELRRQLVVDATRSVIGVDWAQAFQPQAAHAFLQALKRRRFGAGL